MLNSAVLDIRRFRSLIGDYYSFLAATECLLVLASYLAAFEGFFFSDKLAVSEAVKSTKCTLSQSDQRKESRLHCAGCLGVSVGMSLFNVLLLNTNVRSGLI